MLEGLLQLLLVLIILVVAWYIIQLGATHFGAPAILVQILGLIFLLIFLIYALQIVVPHARWPWR